MPISIQITSNARVKIKKHFATFMLKIKKLMEN